MVMSVEVSFGIRCRCLLFVSLMFVFVLLVSLFSCVLVVGVENVSSLEVGVVHVSSESGLRNAVRNAPNGTSVVIALDNDITLTEGGLTIPTKKDITLTSNNKEKGFYQLIGLKYRGYDGKVYSIDTINVAYDGVLRLDGIIVTHAEGVDGAGIYIQHDGTLIMYDGKISGNNIPTYLSSGMWSGSGGGVENRGGVFVMFGGEISGNTAGMSGGGVYNVGNFTMHGGKISDNKAEKYDGGGVCSFGGTFEMFSGEISGNVAGNDGGGIRCGKFVMHDGKISNNYANQAGGGVYGGGVWVMFGGEITNNTAGTDGGGVRGHNFTMHDGEISGNHANQAGGGVYADIFNRFGGTISGNTASEGNDLYPLADNGNELSVVTVFVCVCVMIVMVGIAGGLVLYFWRRENGVVVRENIKCQ